MRKSIFGNKRGSVIIYALYFTGGLIFLITSLIGISKGMLAKNGAYALGDIWATSILGEYDIELYRRYGIMGFYGDEGIVKDKLQYFADYSFEEKNYITCGIEKVDLYDYSILKEENLISQIKEVCLTDEVQGLTGKPMNELTYDRGYSAESAGSISDGVRSGLPSYGATSGLSLDAAKDLLKKLTSIKDIFNEAANSFLINKYISYKFRNIYYKVDSEESYLRGEQEYILSGRYSDEANRKSARNKIIALREVMNLIYIEQDPEMSEAALAAGTVATVGYAGPEAAQLIMAAWALAESINDYELLKSGKVVPLMKTDESWAIDLDSVLNNTESGCVDTGNTRGENYTDYLMYLLYLTPDYTKLLRMMDLMELNLRETYTSEFRIKDYYVGLRYSLKVNGEEFSFEDEY